MTFEQARAWCRNYIYTRVYAAGAPLKPGARETLEAARSLGVPMYLVSATERQALKYTLNRLDIGRYFDFFESTCFRAQSKRDVALFERCAARMGVSAADCLLVEDSLDQLLGNFSFDYASGWEDICFKNGPIVTVSFFRDVVMPRYKRIRKKLDQHGIDIWYTDCDGDVRPILPYLLEGGINCLFPYEVNSCAHPGELLDQYQGQLRIMGGFDKMQLGAGREAIEALLKDPSSGFVSLKDNAIKLVEEGKTTSDEVLRVVYEDI
jgi:HAD superfamily hydrolase (TIGR01509 family)